jgi:hypothetical protein
MCAKAARLFAHETCKRYNDVTNDVTADASLEPATAFGFQVGSDQQGIFGLRIHET